MCFVSNITDWGMTKWTAPPYQLPQTFHTGGVPAPTRQEWEEFKDMIKKALELDQKTGQPDCVDPKKQAWMDEMSKVYDKLYA